MNAIAYRKVRAEARTILTMKRRVAEWWRNTHQQHDPFPGLAEALMEIGLVQVNQDELAPVDGTKH